MEKIINFINNLFLIMIFEYHRSALSQILKQKEKK